MLLKKIKTSQIKKKLILILIISQFHLRATIKELYKQGLLDIKKL